MSSSVNFSVAVIIPVYNGALYIEDTLISLCNQTMLPSEIIIVDDGSVDNTVDIVRSFSKNNTRVNIQLIQLGTNTGAPSARNYGLMATDAELVVFMDADDLVEPELLEREYNRLHEIEKQMPGKWILCHSACKIIDSLGNEIAPIVRWKQVLPEEILGYQFVRNNIITPSGVLVRRDEILSVGGFDPSVRYNDDADLWLKLAQRGGFAYIDEPLVRVRRHVNNLTSKLRNAIDAEKKLLSKYPIEIIEKAIYRRHLPWWVNAADFASVLYRLDYWDKGYALIKEVVNDKPDYANGFFFLGLEPAEKLTLFTLLYAIMIFKDHPETSDKRRPFTCWAAGQTKRPFSTKS